MKDSCVYMANQNQLMNIGEYLPFSWNIISEYEGKVDNNMHAFTIRGISDKVLLVFKDTNTPYVELN